MLKLILTSFLVFSFLSCQTIHYVNSENPEPPHAYEFAEWHHIGLEGLWEISPPVNVRALCGGKSWKAVRTQKNVLQSLVSAVAQSAFGAISGGVPIKLYSPEEVSVACGPQASSAPHPAPSL